MADEQKFKDPRIAKRIEKADTITKNLGEKGYERKNATIGLVAANIVALFVMAPLMIALYFGFNAVHPDAIKNALVESSPIASFVFLIAMYVFINKVWRTLPLQRATLVSGEMNPQLPH